MKLQCKWCKQIFEEKDFVTRNGMDVCFFCDDKMTEYEEDARRDAWDRKHGREIDEDVKED